MVNCINLIYRTLSLYEYTDTRLEMLQAQVGILIFDIDWTFICFYMVNCIYLMQTTLALYEYTDTRLEMLQAQVGIRICAFGRTNFH